MKTTEFKLLIKIVISTVIIYGIHKLLFSQILTTELQDNFIYSLELLYCFFFFASVLITAVLFVVNKKNINNVGFTFLFLTVAKMGIAFFFMQPILKAATTHMSLEKKNFLIIFLIFLTLETVVAIKILNSKQ